MRARVWPQVWLCIIVLVAVIAICWVHFGWLPTLVGCIAIAVVGFGVLAGYGMRHTCTDEETKRCEQVLPGHDILKPEDVRSQAASPSTSIARLPTSIHTSPR